MRTAGTLQPLAAADPRADVWREAVHLEASVTRRSGTDVTAGLV